MKSLKFIEASGQPFEIGYQIGEATREETKQNVERSLDYVQKNLGLTKQKMQAFSVPFLERCQIVFPDYIEELKGMSAGSKVPFTDLFLSSLEEEFEMPGGCSSIGVTSVGEAFIGHNEDWYVDLNLYVVRAKPEGKPKFLALSQCGNIPNILGINEYGFAFVSNSVDYKFDPEGLPKMYFLRKLMEIENIKHLFNYLDNTKRTLGCNIIASFGNQLYKIEWSQDKFNFSTENLFQTNHFTTPGMECQVSETSRIRLENLEKLYEDGKSIEEILSSHKNNPDSICRHNERKTLASVIIDASGRKMQIAYGNPCKTEFKEYKL